MSRAALFLLSVLGAWATAARRHPIWTAGLGVLMILLLLFAAGRMVQTWLEQRASRVATGPIFALSGIATVALALLTALIDGALALAGEAQLGERFVRLLGPEDVVRQTLNVPQGRIVLPAPLSLPLSVALFAIVYLILVLWAGRTLAEMVSLEQKPDDILAKERAAHQKAIADALKEGRQMPQAEVVSLPLNDDLFGRTYKLLGHWTSVELVEERFVRWQKPLVFGIGTLLFLSLYAAAGGHMHSAIWAGALLLVDGLQKNLKTPPKPPEKEETPAEPKPATIDLPSVRPMIEAVHKSAGPLAVAPTEPIAGPAQISPGTALAAKRVLEDMLRELGMGGGLYVHQGLACDAFAERRNVLVTTPPQSGKRTLLDLLMFYTLLVDSETVLYLAPDETEAARAEERFVERAEAAKWQWNIFAARIAGKSGAVDPGRAQPGLVFADPEALHRDLCGHQDDWKAYLGTLGLVVVPDLDRYYGARGAHLAHLVRRLRRAAARSSPDLPPRASGERLRFLATASPLFRDLGKFAERLIGRPFHVLGPEVDGAPRPDAFSYLLPARTAASDLHPAVVALGEALGVGLSAELFGYDDTLAATDVTRANEIMIGRGVATRGRSFTDVGGSSKALADAQVVVARASAARFASLSLLVSHVGYRVGRVPKAKRAALGKGESVGAGAARKEEEIEPKVEQTEAPADGTLTMEQIAAANLEQKVIHFFQPDLEPFSALLVKERPHPSHPDLGHGCTLVIDPSAENVQLAHMRSALSEAEKTEDELNADFSPALVSETLAQLRSDTANGLLERRRKVIETATGEAKTVCTFRLSTPLASDFATRAAGEPARVIDRHTGDILFAVERERALAAAYPGRVFVRRKKRFCVLPFEEQDAAARGEIACEREERLVTTSKIRSMDVSVVERRSGGDRRSSGEPIAAADGSSVSDRRVEDRRAAYQRAAAARTLGGVSFSLRSLPANVTEHVLGFRRFDLNGLVRDTTLYPEPITCSFSGKATVMGFPASSFNEVSEATLHTLAHLFRTTLGAFLHHTEEDVDVVWLPSFGPEKEHSIAFIDLHPGGAGFSEGCSLDVLRACVRWSLALVRRCPGGCDRSSGCLFCIQIRDCHSTPDEMLNLDKAGADRVLSLLVGVEEAKRFDAPTKGAP